MKKLTNKKGFTLVELLVVVAIIAILMLIALPKFLDSTKGAKIRTFESNARTLISAANTSLANNGGVVGVNIQKDTADLVKQINTDGTNNPGRPEGATYVVDANGETITCTLPAGKGAKDAAGADVEYKIVYSVKDGTLTQTPATLPSGATNLTIK